MDAFYVTKGEAFYYVVRTKDDCVVASFRMKEFNTDTDYEYNLEDYAWNIAHDLNQAEIQKSVSE